MAGKATTLGVPVIPDNVSTMRIETYRGASCWRAIWNFLNGKRTGSFKVHVTQGTIAVVQFEISEKT